MRNVEQEVKNARLYLEETIRVCEQQKARWERIVEAIEQSQKDWKQLSDKWNEAYNAENEFYLLEYSHAINSSFEEVSHELYLYRKKIYALEDTIRIQKQKLQNLGRNGSVVQDLLSSFLNKFDDGNEGNN